MNKLRIQKGDKVLVLSGKDKGKTGIVGRVMTKTRSVIIPKINVVKKHIKATKENPAGGVVDTERPVPVSNVQLVCPSCGKRTRVGLEKKGDDKKRICKKCKKAIEFTKTEKKPAGRQGGEK